MCQGCNKRLGVEFNKEEQAEEMIQKIKRFTWSPNDIGSKDIKKDFIARCHVEVGTGGFLRFPFAHDKKGRNWLDERLMSEFLEKAISQSKEELVEEITEELKKQIIYVKARTEREYRDKDNIIFNGVSYHYMDANQRVGFLMALNKTVEYLSLLQKDKETRKNINEWAKEMGYVILDPDGFDRTDPEVMTRLRTKEEFDKGFIFCTIEKLKDKENKLLK